MDRSNWDKIVSGAGAVIAVVLIALGAMAIYGGNFGQQNVRDRLVPQNISFPPAEAMTPQEKAEIGEFAGQKVENGVQAEAFSRYIGGHLEAINDGATYSETSAAAREEGLDADNAAELQGKADTLFKGESLRAMLLNAYGWWTVATIALWAGVAMLIAGAAHGDLLDPRVPAREEGRRDDRRLLGGPARRASWAQRSRNRQHGRFTGGARQMASSSSRLSDLVRCTGLPHLGSRRLVGFCMPSGVWGPDGPIRAIWVRATSVPRGRAGVRRKMQLEGRRVIQVPIVASLQEALEGGWKPMMEGLDPAKRCGRWGTSRATMGGGLGRRDASSVRPACALRSCCSS